MQPPWEDIISLITCCALFQSTRCLMDVESLCLLLEEQNGNTALYGRSAYEVDFSFAHCSDRLTAFAAL